MCSRPGFVLALSACFLFGCGGAKKSADAPASPKVETKASAVDECLAEAAAPRTPRKDAPEKIGISHILVRHRELKRPEGATRSRGEACLRAREAREKLLAGADWDEVAKQYSDAGDATNGKLGRVSKSELDETFGNAAFGLDVGELSHVVETPRGFHVIARTE